LLKKLDQFLEYEARKKEAAKPKLQSKRARLIVRNLGFNVTKVESCQLLLLLFGLLTLMLDQDVLQRQFSRYGKVIDCHVVKTDQGRSRGATRPTVDADNDLIHACDG
jgi:hypothetical protein